MSDEVIDREELKRLLDVIGGDPNDLAELIEEFEKDTPKSLARMEEAANAGDLETLRITSHSLKSNGQDFGAAALAEACAALEQDCKNGLAADPVAQVRSIADELQRTRKALSDISLGNG